MEASQNIHETSGGEGEGDTERWCKLNSGPLRKGSISMDEIQSEVVPRDFLCCPLCREEYLEPKYLPCLHSFCKACIDEHIEATGDREAHNFDCPVCATPTALPSPDQQDQEGGPDLPDNTFARRLSCPAIIRDKREKSCQQCGAAGEVSTHCINCDEFLCGQCSLKHLDQMETASHKTQTIQLYEEAERSSSRERAGDSGGGGDGGEGEPAPLPKCCALYDALDIGALYCVDCETALCADCRQQEHAEHRCAELSALADNFERKIKAPLRELRKDRHSLRRTAAALQGAEDYVERKRKDLQQAVRRRTRQLCEQIQQYEGVLGQEIDQRSARNLAAIKERESCVQRHLASVEAVLEFTEKLLVFGSQEEKVAMRRKIGRRVRELCEDELPTRHVHINKAVLVEPDVTVDTICEMFGELRTDTTTSSSTTTSQSTKVKAVLTPSHSIDLGLMSRRRGRLSTSEDLPPAELSQLEEEDVDDGDDEKEGDECEADMLSLSNTSDTFRLASSSGSSSLPSRSISHEELKLSGASTSLLASLPSHAQHHQTHNDAATASGVTTLPSIELSSSTGDVSGCGTTTTTTVTRQQQQQTQLPQHTPDMQESVSLVDTALSPRAHDLSGVTTSLSPYRAQEALDSSFHSSSSTQDEVPCHNLEEAKREMTFPEVVARDCIKGVGVNHQGDIVVGTVSPRGISNVFILEKHGIVRGHIDVDKNWGIHSIAADGKVSLIVARSENRYKVKVMSGENNVEVLVDAHIESFGLNSLTATRGGTLLVCASRYAAPNPALGRSAKSGGNVTMYDREGKVVRVITNSSFAHLNMYVFERPHHVAVDRRGYFFVADPGRHSVIGFKPDGEFLFEHGNTDAEEELYQGPDAVCVDRWDHVVVYDKKDGRIDILSYQGQLLRCYFPSEHVRFVCPTPDRMLMLVNSEGEMKFYEYM